MPTQIRPVETIRQDITAVHTRLEVLRHVVLPLDMALERLQSWVDAQAEAYNPRGIPHFMHAGAAFHFRLTADATPNDITQLVCGLFPETVYDDLKGRLEAHYAARPEHQAMPPDAKEETMREAREALLALETEEEAAIRVIEAEGRTVVRRGDIEFIEVLLAD